LCKILDGLGEKKLEKATGEGKDNKSMRGGKRRFGGLEGKIRNQRHKTTKEPKGTLTQFSNHSVKTWGNGSGAKQQPLAGIRWFRIQKKVNGKLGEGKERNTQKWSY